MIRQLSAIPGTLCNAKLWEGVQSQLSKLHLIHIPIERENSLEAIRTRIQSACEGTDHMMGFSMGGYLSLVEASERDNIQSLVVIGASGVGQSEEKTAEKQQILKHLDRVGDKFKMSRTRLNQFIEPQSSEYKQVTQKIRDMERDLGPAVLKHQITATLNKTDLQEALKTIQCPVLLIAGEKDQIIPLQEIEDTAKALPNGRLEVIEGAGHMLPLEHPQKVAQLIEHFHRSFD